jgi:hypothetical protein
MNVIQMPSARPDWRGPDVPPVPAVFQRVGPLMTGDELALVMRSCVDQPVSQIAQWIAHRQVINFVWRAQFMLPMFQFEPGSMRPRPPVCKVIAELAGAFDDWDIAVWFSHPNAWLDGELPAHAIVDDATSVVQAARADRFLATA